MRGPLKPRVSTSSTVAAVAVFIDPSADGITLEGRLDHLRPIAAVGEDAAQRVVVGDQDVGRVRRDDEFERPERDHHERHAGGNAAGVVDGGALPAGILIGKARLEDLLIFRRERRLLPPSPRLGLVERRLSPHARNCEAIPLTVQVGIFAVIERPGAADRQQQHRSLRHHTQRTSVKH